MPPQVSTCTSGASGGGQQRPRRKTTRSRRCGSPSPNWPTTPDQGRSAIPATCSSAATSGGYWPRRSARLMPAGPPELLPGPAAARARRALRDDVRAGPGVFVADFDEDPAMLAGTGQGEAAGELAARQDEGHMVWLRAHDLRRALIPDDHRAAAARLALVHALEVTCRDARAGFRGDLVLGHSRRRGW